MDASLGRLSTGIRFLRPRPDSSTAEGLVHHYLAWRPGASAGMSANQRGTTPLRWSVYKIRAVPGRRPLGVVSHTAGNGERPHSRQPPGRRRKNPGDRPRHHLPKSPAVRKSDITSDLVSRLIAEQFPAWADLPVRPVAAAGGDKAEC